MITPMFNHYMEFGNSMMDRYSGMSSRINPLSLLYLQGEEETEEQPRPTQVTYIQNRIYKLTRHEYNTVSNRYLINYQKTAQVIQNNPIYAASPNFRQYISPVSFVHVKQEEKEAKQESRPSVQNVPQLRELVRDTVREVSREQEKTTVLEILRENTQAESRLYTVLEKELRTLWQEKEKYAEKEIRTEMTRVVTLAVEQAVRRLPDETRKQLSAGKGQNLRSVQNSIIPVEETERLTQTLIRQLAAPATPQAAQPAVITGSRQFTQTARPVTVTKSRPLSQTAIGKELFQAQVMERIRPLPVRPVDLVFTKENGHAAADTADSSLETKSKTPPAVLQRTNIVVKKEHQAEHKYYTHIVDRFLKNQETQKNEEPDRSKLPAGIIWHDRPKELTRFERRDIIQIPVELVYGQEARNAAEDNKPQTGSNGTQAGTAVQMQNAAQPPQNLAAINHPRPAVHPAPALPELPPADLLYYGQERRVVRSPLPVFTADQGSTHPVSQSAPIRNIQFDWKGSSLDLVIPAASLSAEQTEALNTVIRRPAMQSLTGNTLELVIPTASSPTGAAVPGQTEAIHAAAPHTGTARPAAPPIQRPAEMSPVPLIYKSENRPEESAAPEKKEESTKFLDDIVFEKKTVSGKKTNNDIVVDGAGDGAPEIPGVTVTGPTGGNSRTVVSRAEVDTIISEKVSRHVDENISRISRQVYKDIERQLKKERDRRGK